MISKDEVRHIVKLARLELTEREVEKMQKDLSVILDYFKLLEKAPKPSPVVRTTGLRENVTRRDEVADSPASLANNLIQMAPDRKEEYIKVKTIL